MCSFYCIYRRAGDVCNDNIMLTLFIVDCCSYVYDDVMFFALERSVRTRFERIIPPAAHVPWIPGLSTWHDLPLARPCKSGSRHANVNYHRNEFKAHESGFVSLGRLGEVCPEGWTDLPSNHE